MDASSKVCRRFLGLIALTLALTAGALWAQQHASSGISTSNATPARILVVATDATDSEVGALVGFLEDAYPVRVNAIDEADYRPFIEERIYDGFVFLGQNYFHPPSEAFLSDMSRTSKQLLWINYHAWHLDPSARTRLQMDFFDLHDSSFTKIYFNGIRALASTDTSLVKTGDTARVLYWLYNDDLTASVPGAAVSGNMTYVSYLPVFSGQQPDLMAFRAATDAAFSQIKARAPAPLSPDARLALAWADSFRDGVHLPYVYDEVQPDIITYDDDILHERLLRIKDAGAEWLTISQTYFQDGIRGTNVAPHEFGTSSFSALEDITRDAHAIGMHVRLSIVVNLTEESRRPLDWRGAIRPADVEKWWRAYRQIVLRAARFAKNVGIESLNVGAELNAMQADEEKWRALVADVRRIAGYKGLIGYQANYNGIGNMTWGDVLDYLSVAAYWPLANKRDPSMEELTSSWDAVGKELRAWLEKNPGVEIEFGEIGYVSQPYTAEFPFSWKPNRARQLNLTEQLNCYLALKAFLEKTPEIVGIGMFASTRYDLVPDDIGYTPFGKPAEAVLERLLNLR